MRFKPGVSRARHQGTQKDGLESTAVIGEVTMRLAKGGNDLRHLETEHTVRVGERGPMTMRVSLVPFGRVRPDLNALPRERGSVAGAAHGACHPEAAATDPFHDRRVREVVVGTAPHRGSRCEALRMDGQQEGGNPCRYDGAATGEETTAVEHDASHVSSS